MNPGNQKGYVLVWDAFLAGLVFLLAINFIAQASGQVKVDRQWGLLVIAQDALDVLDERNVLETGDADQIRKHMQELLPAHLDWYLKVEEFEFKNSDFELKKTKEYGNAQAEARLQDVIHVRRLGVGFEKNKTQYFYNSELQVWVK